MTVRPERTAPLAKPGAEHHRFEDRHGGPDGVRHHIDEERLGRLARAAQEVSERAEREKRQAAGQDGQADGRGGERQAAPPAPRTASIVDIERADYEGMIVPEET